MPNITDRVPLKLTIHIENLPHGVFRKLLVPDYINMMQLHGVLQIAMGWTFSHLFQFVDTRQQPKLIASLGEIDSYEELPSNEFEAHRILLKRDYMEKLGRKNLWYWYDFGDDWWHKISLLKPTKQEVQNFEGFPICLDAFGKCPLKMWVGLGDIRNFVMRSTTKNIRNTIPIGNG